MAFAPYLFWITTDGIVRRASEEGGAPVTLATGFPQVDCIAANSTDVYWWDYASGNAYRLPIASDAGAPVVYYSTSGSTGGCVAADDRVVVLTTPAGLLQRDLDSGTVTSAVPPGTPGHHQLVLSGPDVYFELTVPSSDDGGTQVALGHVTLGSTAVDVAAPGAITGTVQLAAAHDAAFWAQGQGLFGCADFACTAGVRHYSNALPSATGTLADSTWIYAISNGSGRMYKVTQ